MNLSLNYIVFCLFTFLALNLMAQGEDYIYENFTAKDGLANDLVYDIVEDKEGFIWILTWDGVSRFDGHSFKNFYYDPKDSTSLLPSTQLLVNEAGDLWVTNLGQQEAHHRYSSFDKNTFSFVQHPTVWSNYAVYLVDSLEREFLISLNSNQNRVSAFNLKTKQNTSYTYPSSTNLTEVTGTFFVDNDSHLWVSDAARTQLFKMTLPQDTSARELVLLDSLALKEIQGAPPKIDEIYYDRVSTHTWVLAESGLYLLDLEGKRMQKKKAELFLLKNQHHTNKAERIVANQAGHIFLTNRKEQQSSTVWGLSVYKPQKETFRLLEAFKGIYVQTLFWGRNGILWVGTKGKGIYRVTEPKKLFSYPLMMKDNYIFDIFEVSDSTIWLGTKKGLYNLNLSNQRASPILLNEAISTPSMENLLKHCRIDNIFKEDNNFWIGTANHGLFKYDKDFKLLERYHEGTNSLLTNTVRDIYKDEDGDLWFGAESGLWIKDAKTGAFTSVLYDKNKSRTTMSKGIRTIFKDSEGDMWFDGENGLTKYTKKTKKLEKFYPYPNHHPRHNTNTIYTIMEGDSSLIWVGTSGGGLCGLDKKKGMFTKQFTTLDGLSNNVVYSILKDEGGNLWMSTNKGVSRFNVKDESFTNFGKTDGLSFEEFNTGAYLQSKSGEFFLGGTDGLVNFHPDSILLNEENKIPPLVITEFRVMNQPERFQRHTFNNDTVSISYEDNYFQIEFAALDYMEASDIVYYYKMEGVDNEPVRCTNKNRIASYSNLKPGKYIFHVYLTTGKEPSNKTGVKMLIRILPMFYQTWWFYLLASIAVVSLLFLLLFTWYSRLTAEQKQREETLHRQRHQAMLQSLRAQMNPHFIFNSLNSVNNFIAQNNQRAANQYLVDFSKLTRMVLEQTKLEVIPLSEEIETLKLYLGIEHLRFKDKFDYQVDIDPKLNTQTLKIPPMLLQPYLENAIWHGLRYRKSKGTLQLTFKKLSHHLLCLIEDNGIGREQSKELKKNSVKIHKPTGMSNVNERLSIINTIYKTHLIAKIEDLYDENGKPRGTKVQLTIPLAHAGVDSA